MTNYEYLKENEAKLKEFASLGFVSGSVLNNISVYEAYLKVESEELTDRLKFDLVARKTGYGAEMVRKIIYKLKKPLLK